MDSLTVKPAAPTADSKPIDATVTQVTTSENGGVMRVQATAPAPKPTEEKPAGDRPAWLPEKFKSPEDLAKAYSELEKKQGQQPKPDEKKPDEKPQDAPKPDEVKDSLKAAGLDLKEFDSEYQKEGKLSEASYEKLTKAGFPKQLVDQYIAGQESIAQTQMAQVHGEAGGKDGYTETVQWAAQNLSADEVTSYNKIMESGDLNAQKIAARDLRARFERENGSQPTLRAGATKGAGGSADVFGSMQEVAQAMKDPRYTSGDPAYHAYIDAKLARSNV